MKPKLKYNKTNALPERLVYNKYTIVSFSHKSKGSVKYYNCVCECGTRKPIALAALKHGSTNGCQKCQYRELGERAKFKPCSQERLEELFRMFGIDDENKKIIYRIRNRSTKRTVEFN